MTESTDWELFYGRYRRGVSPGRPRAVATFLARAPKFSRAHYVTLHGRQWQLRRAQTHESTGLSDRPDVACGQLVAWLEQHGIEPATWIAEKAPRLAEAATWWAIGGSS